MTAMPAEANFSELIQKPKDTVARMQVNARRGLLLRRRDEEDLYLTTAAALHATFTQDHGESDFGDVPMPPWEGE
ncbi:hypothetical protein R2B67_24450 [Streptomyces cyaneofuscatus]|uniref:hypothetical protein n=1 Tax=Streptomyces cyaneofuscatus TaxID=66883 RepID=UPI002953E88B|nr:hypothetical protein [Streptomyces cyaneofuscatus]WOP11490.1 hypothetical protein R2B67_24450 [Streptomyces cyaneofuscatus]